MLGWLKSVVHTVREERSLPPAAKAERRRDQAGLSAADPGAKAVADACIAWLAEAQDRSTTRDGGVARHYSLIDGWGSSYPETTGYIIPTFFDYAEQRRAPEFRDRARQMLDWLVAIQFPEGGFQGGRIDSTPVVPVTFNTGQILIGLSRGAAEFETYREPMRRAAGWLTATLDDDGCWRRHPTPFAAAGEKAYETHVAWGLFEAARIEPDQDYGRAGLANVRWALARQRDNGWVADCCLDDPDRPLTHTLGYFLRGVIEGYRFHPDPEILAAARRTADGLLSALDDDGRLPGRLNPDWTAAVPWVCLTGSAQIAHCWLLLHEITGEPRYRNAGAAANGYVRRTVRVDGPVELRGAVKGAFPVDGEYGRFQFLNWAAKFCADANLAELQLKAAPRLDDHPARTIRP